MFPSLLAAPNPVPRQLPGVRYLSVSLLAANPADWIALCPEQAVHSMLDYLDLAGGIRAYLGGIGLGAAEITRLRARLR